MKAKEKKILKRLKDEVERINTKLNLETLQSRKYHDCLTISNKIISLLLENPFHPENDYASEIFLSIEEGFELLEKLN